MDFFVNGRRKKIGAKKVEGVERLLGLMFRPSRSENLLFEFDKDVRVVFHSWFVFFNFLILWMDDKNNVLEWRIVRPFNFFVKAKGDFRKVIEIPFNSRNRKLISEICRRKI